MDSSTSRHGAIASIFASGNFRRLWALGGLVNATRWVEMLAAGLFVFRATGSGFDVAIVLAARSLPMLLLGATIGVVCDSVDRRRVLVAGMLISTAVAGTIALLGLAGLVRPWHLAVAAFISGTVWSTELSARRRMIGECAGPASVSRVIALDSLTNSLARILGPLLGSLTFAYTGLPGAYGLSAATSLIGLALVQGVRHTQTTRPLLLSRIPQELAEGFRYAAGHVTVLGVLGVTAAMNLFAFSYSAIIAPLARLGFGMSEAMTGLLAAGEPLGAAIGGLLLAGRALPTRPLPLLIGGSTLFMASLAVMSLMPGYVAACLVLVAGGLGLALFGNMQTSLILTEVPAALRSRQMGLITVCIGMAPLGQILMGVLSEQFGVRGGVLVSGLTGLAALGAIARLCARKAPSANVAVTLALAEECAPSQTSQKSH
jgi:MFS family permease